MQLTPAERRNLPHVSGWLRDAANQIDTYALHCLTVTHPEPARTTGHAGNGSGPSGDPSDSTGNMVAGALDANDWLVKKQAALLQAISSAFDSARDACDLMVSIKVRYPAVKDPRARDDDGSDLCVEKWCKNPRGGRRSRSRCDPCGDWLANHKYPDGTYRAEVPREVIEARDDLRARKEAKRAERERQAAEIQAAEDARFVGSLEEAVSSADLVAAFESVGRFAQRQE